MSASLGELHSRQAVGFFVAFDGAAEVWVDTTSGTIHHAEHRFRSFSIVELLRRGFCVSATSRMTCSASAPVPAASVLFGIFSQQLCSGG